MHIIDRVPRDGVEEAKAVGIFHVKTLRNPNENYDGTSLTNISTTRKVIK